MLCYSFLYVRVWQLGWGSEHLGLIYLNYLFLLILVWEGASDIWGKLIVLMYMFLEKNYELKHTTANLTTVFRQLILSTTVSEEEKKETLHIKWNKINKIAEPTSILKKKSLFYFRLLWETTLFLINIPVWLCYHFICLKTNILKINM